MGTVQTKVDDVSGDAVGDEYFLVRITRYARNGDGWAREPTQRLLEVTRPTIANMLEVGEVRTHRGRPPK